LFIYEWLEIKEKAPTSGLAAAIVSAGFIAVLSWVLVLILTLIQTSLIVRNMTSKEMTSRASSISYDRGVVSNCHSMIVNWEEEHIAARSKV
jgi:hypothetical protein